MQRKTWTIYFQGSTKTLFCFKNQPFCFQNVFCPKRVFKTRFKTRHLFQSLCPRFAIFLFQMFLFCFDFLDVVDVVFKFCGSQCVKYSLFLFCFLVKFSKEMIVWFCFSLFYIFCLKLLLCMFCCSDYYFLILFCFDVILCGCTVHACLCFCFVL